MANTNENKKELAHALYMSGMKQEDIAAKADISRQTLCRWISAGGWKEMKAAKTITRQQLVNKMLTNINALLDKASQEGNEDMLAGLGDKLIKTATAIEKLEKKGSVVNQVDTLIAIENWLSSNRDNYPEMDNDTFILINRIHNDYLNSLFTPK